MGERNDLDIRNSTLTKHPLSGSFHEMGTPEYEALLPVGSRQPGSRAVVVVDVYKCGTVSMRLSLQRSKR
jgi:hypothetical protein